MPTLASKQSAAIDQVAPSRIVVDKSTRRWRTILLLLAVKPFIDLLWNYEFSIAGLRLNPPRVVAVVMFFACVSIYFRDMSRKAAAKTSIFVFLACNTVATVYAFALNETSMASVANSLLRIFDAYLLYLIASRMWSSRFQIYAVAKVIWLSTLAVNVLSVLVWRSGTFNVSVTSTTQRFAGLYNDAGGPAYNAVFCLIFAAIVHELIRFDKRNVEPWLKLLLVVTIPVSGMLLVLSITKSAFLMLGMFLLLWWGVYKQKHFIIAPALFCSSTCRTRPVKQFRTG
jgi:hypothetical protein